MFVFFDKSGFGIYFILSALLHEAGHLLVMGLVGVHVDCVNLSFGGILIQRQQKCDRLGELMVLLAGPVTNIILAVILFAIGDFVFSSVNTSLAVYHLFPIKGLDGWCILNNTACWIWGMKNGERMTKIISTLFATVMIIGIVIGVFWYGLSIQLLLMAGVIGISVIINMVGE